MFFIYEFSESSVKVEEDTKYFSHFLVFIVFIYFLLTCTGVSKGQSPDFALCCGGESPSSSDQPHCTDSNSRSKQR